MEKYFANNNPIINHLKTYNNYYKFLLLETTDLLPEIINTIAGFIFSYVKYLNNQFVEQGCAYKYTNYFLNNEYLRNEIIIDGGTPYALLRMVAGDYQQTFGADKKTCIYDNTDNSIELTIVQAGDLFIGLTFSYENNTNNKNSYIKNNQVIDYVSECSLKINTDQFKYDLNNCLQIKTYDGNPELFTQNNNINMQLPKEERRKLYITEKNTDYEYFYYNNTILPLDALSFCERKIKITFKDGIDIEGITCKMLFSMLDNVYRDKLTQNPIIIENISEGKSLHIINRIGRLI